MPKFLTLMLLWILLVGGNLLVARLLPFSIRPPLILTFCVSVLLILITSGRSSVPNAVLLLSVAALAGEAGSGLSPGSVFLVTLGVLLLLTVIGRKTIPTLTAGRTLTAAMACVFVFQVALVIIHRTPVPSLAFHDVFRDALYVIVIPTLLAGPLVFAWDLFLRRPFPRRLVLQSSGALPAYESVGRR